MYVYNIHMDVLMAYTICHVCLLVRGDAGAQGRGYHPGPILHYDLLYYTTLYYTILYTILHYPILSYPMLYQAKETIEESQQTILKVSGELGSHGADLKQLEKER